MSFDTLGLEADLLRAIADEGYDQPTPVQSAAIPPVLAGRDVMAAARTGTGKTAAFVLPILQRLEPRRGARRPRSLVLAPTRELAAQIHASVVDYGKYLGHQSAVVFGGVNIRPQIAALARGLDVLVATPGRLLDLAGQGAVDLSGIEILVLDEADRMLDMGFIHDIRRVMKLLPDKERRQNLLFSATFSKEIRELSGGLLNSPERIDTAPANSTAERAEQRAVHVDKSDKRDRLASLIQGGDWRQVLVFTRTKHGANRLAKQLENDGIGAMAIHGNKSQNARTRALEAFKSRELRVLVATDIAARGLDIEELPYVVNYELPNVPEDYVHRIGRTARAGQSGLAVSLVEPEERKLLSAIERLLGMRVPVISEAEAGMSTGPRVRRPDEDEPDRPARPPGGRGRGGGAGAGARSNGSRGQGGGARGVSAGRGGPSGPAPAGGAGGAPGTGRRRRRRSRPSGAVAGGSA